MVVRDLLCETDEARVIARAIYEDGFGTEDVEGWITKYYAQFTELKNSKVFRFETMLLLQVNCENNRYYGDVSGLEYSDIKKGKTICYAIEFLDVCQYASLYVPLYTVQRYGKEVVAAEALREYGWNGYDENIVCPDSIRVQIREALVDMKSGIFPVDQEYLTRCKAQFELEFDTEFLQWSISCPD